MRPALQNTPLAKGWIQHSLADSSQISGDDFMDQYLTSAMWLGQCSLAAVSRMLEAHASEKVSLRSAPRFRCLCSLHARKISRKLCPPTLRRIALPAGCEDGTVCPLIGFFR